MKFTGYLIDIFYVLLDFWQVSHAIRIGFSGFLASVL